MQQNIVLDISPENSSQSGEDEVIKIDQQNSSILSVRAPNLFYSDTPQLFQKISGTYSIQKQHTVTFDALNTSEGERKQLNKWKIQEKENRNRNTYTIATENVSANSKKHINESVEYLQKQKSYQQQQNNSNQYKKSYQSKRATYGIYSSINNFQNQSMTQELLELDLPALITQLTKKRRAYKNNSFHNNNSFYNSNNKPQMPQKQGCIVRQSFNKQNSQEEIPIVQQTKERSITMNLRQPGKIVNQKQLKSSIATRK